jgi:hypothetical protein
MRVGRAPILRWKFETDFKVVLCQHFGEYFRREQIESAVAWNSRARISNPTCYHSTEMIPRSTKC